MRAALLIAVGGTLALAGAGCAPSLHVQTMVAPDAGLATLATFRILTVPPPADGRVRAGAYDPMVNNSIMNRALRETITKVLVERGYVLNEQSPDVGVAVYASAREKLDVSTWDYGYPFWPRAGWYRPLWPVGTEYSEGTVVVDIVRERDHELLWRGSASERMSEDPAEDVKTLQKVAAAVMKKFPLATPRPVVALR